jgi:hypothetical protein
VLDVETMPAWERRFRAPNLGMPDWSPRAPDRITYASTESGVWQLHAWDRGATVRRRVTDHPVGVTDGTPTLDGEGVLWFQDETGAESGRWMSQSFHGGDSRPLVEGIPVGWNEGLAQAPGVVALGISDSDGFAIWVSSGGGPPVEIHRHREAVRIAGSDFASGFNRVGLSADGSLLCLTHSESGDLIHPALRVVDPRTGRTVGEQLDEGLALTASCWSPVEGDQRLVIVHEREGEERPGIWNLKTGERTDLKL